VRGSRPVNSLLSYLERLVFPGGCIFAAVAMELDTRPGPTRDRVVEVLNSWRASLLDAQASREIDPGADVDQAVFEVQAMLFAANFLFVGVRVPSVRLACIFAATCLVPSLVYRGRIN
jgi:hypothetical protein